MSGVSESNGNVLDEGGGGTASQLKPTSSSTEDLSEYTDADESISAPTEFLAEFLSAVMLKDYETALKYCKLILQYEPNNATAQEFYPLILQKLRHLTYSDSNPSSDSEQEEHPCSTSASSDDSSSSSSEAEDEVEDEDEGSASPDQPPRIGNNKQTSSDGDATTASYSSLEDEEADQMNNMISRVDNVDLGNGNKIICDTSGSNIWELKKNTTSVPFGTSSDSESPTEPITQQTIANLRAKVVPPYRN